jgi:hypothetical protein
VAFPFEYSLRMPWAWSTEGLPAVVEVVPSGVLLVALDAFLDELEVRLELGLRDRLLIDRTMPPKGGLVRAAVAREAGSGR